MKLHVREAWEQDKHWEAPHFFYQGVDFILWPSIQILPSTGSQACLLPPKCWGLRHASSCLIHVKILKGLQHISTKKPLYQSAYNSINHVAPKMETIQIPLSVIVLIITPQFKGIKVLISETTWMYCECFVLNQSQFLKIMCNCIYIFWKRQQYRKYISSCHRLGVKKRFDFKDIL